MVKSGMILKGFRDAGEFPALVVAAFFVRNTGILFALIFAALFALAAG
jgi:hypothetical protein